MSAPHYAAPRNPAKRKPAEPIVRTFYNAMGHNERLTDGNEYAVTITRGTRKPARSIADKRRAAWNR